jgi:hypothetical protein
MVEALNGIVGVGMRAALQGWEMATFAYNRTDVARNRMAHVLLESDCDALVMLDSDHIHDPRLPEYLAMAAVAHPDMPIIAGLNYRRTPPHEPMAYRRMDDGTMGAITHWGEGLVEVDAISTAALLVRREVFEAIAPPWFQYGYAYYDNGNSTSEDIGFCHRIKTETDFPIYVHTQLTSPHITTRTITDADFRAQLAQRDGEQL